MSAIGETSAQLALRDPDTRLMIGVRADEPGAFEEIVDRFRNRLVAAKCTIWSAATPKKA